MKKIVFGYMEGSSRQKQQESRVLSLLNEQPWIWGWAEWGGEKAQEEWVNLIYFQKWLPGIISVRNQRQKKSH